MIVEIIIIVFGLFIGYKIGSVIRKYLIKRYKKQEVT